VTDVETLDDQRPEAIQAQLRETVGIGRFKPVPDRFDPLKASPRALRAHGFPARPDAKLHPRLHEQWERILSQPIRLIDPQFAVMRDKGHGSHQAYGPPAGNGWGGSIAFAPKDDRITFVSGQWTVPRIAAPKPGNSICACWIGIDGANGDPYRDDSNDILQAGTTQMIVTTDHWYGDSTDYYSFVWFEWYPAPPVEITNLHASPGDSMYCVICVYSPTEAGIHLLNVTTGLGVSFTKSAPPKVKLHGNCAEWVVENPPSASMSLGRFGNVYFDECVAGTENGQLLLAGEGRMLPMYDSSGHDIAIPTAETDLLVRIRYADAAP